MLSGQGKATDGLGLLAESAFLDGESWEVQSMVLKCKMEMFSRIKQYYRQAKDKINSE
jgi:hypothetical protein